MAITPTQSLSGQDFFTTTLSSSVALSDTVINLNAVPTASEGFLVIDPNNSSTREVIYYNSKTVSSVTCPDATQGSARGIGGTTAQTHASGTAVEMRNVWEYYQYLQSGVSNTGLQQYQDESLFDFVQTGLVWTADAAGSTLLASMTSGTVYIDGRRMTLSSVAGRAFTASKDTYVDVLRTGNVASLVYTEVANNAASPALAANSIRIAIVVTGGSSIAAAASINQGDPASVLPIASSVAYSVTDSLGNLICNRNVNPSIIGYRQTTASQGSIGFAAEVDLTSLSVTVIVPAGRRIKISGYVPANNSSADASNFLRIKEGATQLQQTAQIARVALNQYGIFVAWVGLPTTGSHTYKLSAVPSAGTMTTASASNEPAFIAVELV